MPALVWFREDLRTCDNTGLFHATRHSSSGVVAVYIIDPSLWIAHSVAACRVEFILRGLRQLRAELDKLNIPLLVIEVAATKLIPEKLLELMQSLALQTLFFNRQYEVNESRRDQAVSEYLQRKDIAVYSYDDQVILAPNSVLTQQASYFKVFTPYKRAWQQLFRENVTVGLLPAIKPQPPIPCQSTPLPTRIANFSSSIDPDLWPAGERIASAKLQDFINNQFFNYHLQRDFPAVSGTSTLSPYLASGMISPRQCFLAALSANQQQLDSGNAGAVTWMGELIWREFYKHLLVAVPRVSMGKPYQLQTEKIPWHYDEALLTAWQQGKTGYPLIDAAMRQMHATGWMHNRLRMVTAMFLSKNLFLNWRLGERYFMQHLIDGDLAANNGGWQWCASTGTDAAPYFRVFNPVTQSERFDPDGIFIRQYCPELSAFNQKTIHDPSKRDVQLLEKCAYPQGIVDLAASRKHFIAVFKQCQVAG